MWNGSQPSAARGVVLALVCSLTLVAACERQPDAGGGGSTQPDQLNVVATTGMIADLAREIAGAHARVTQLIGPGVDPHLFSPTRDDVAALEAADVILYNGIHLEGRLNDALDSLRSGDRSVAAVAEAVAQEHLQPDEEDPQQFDPHVWMNVMLWARTAEAVAEVLSKADAAHAEIYAQNLATYRDDLVALDAYAKERMATIPEAQRLLITAHDAFGYLGSAYGIEVRGIQGLSTEAEAGLQHIRELVDLLVERQISTVFVESSVPSKNVEALIEGAAARGHTVTLGGELFSDATGPAGTYEGTYIGMIDHNVTMIVRGLGGEAPAGGMQGKLSAEQE